MKSMLIGRHVMVDGKHGVIVDSGFETQNTYYGVLVLDDEGKLTMRTIREVVIVGEPMERL